MVSEADPGAHIPDAAAVFIAATSAKMHSNRAPARNLLVLVFILGAWIVIFVVITFLIDGREFQRIA